MEQTIDAIAPAAPSKPRLAHRAIPRVPERESLDGGAIGWVFVIPVTLAVLVAICLWLVTISH